MMERENKIEYLPKLISATRKSRIEAERRLLKLDALSKHATIYYACITTLLTLLTIFFNHEALAFLSVASAVIVTMCTVYASAQNYGVRAEQMKRCYLDLQLLHLSLDDKGQMNDEEARKVANQAGERYVEIIERAENHLPRDYELACGKLDKTSDLIRWTAIRLCVYTVPPIVGAVITLLVWSVA